MEANDIPVVTARDIDLRGEPGDVYVAISKALRRPDDRGYSVVIEGRTRLNERFVTVQGHEQWDPNHPNNIGWLGAPMPLPPTQEEIDAAVADMQRWVVNCVAAETRPRGRPRMHQESRRQIGVRLPLALIRAMDAAVPAGTSRDAWLEDIIRAALDTRGD